MKKTVKEWIEFLNMGNNHFIGIESKSATYPSQRIIYVSAKESAEKFNGWLNDIVEGAYICNYVENGNVYHLLLIK